MSVTDENPAFGTPLIGFPEHSSQPLFLYAIFRLFLMNEDVVPFSSDSSHVKGIRT
ncbi:hypothetical protein [Staphylococcus caprae]|uniref:hypothetical protein n=1 Tax=Staphylococcus caprae TaxID=29380 RepID=UPI0002F82553|nr:hypothetical protein [Staphylococcus caprae]MEB8095352.1 hypothetical protein [Staphylococcus caprae]